jgi:hypothetical protein
MDVDLSKKAQAFLQELRFAVLATINHDGTPQLTTISICIEDDYNFLTINGTVHLIDDPQRTQQDIYRLSARYHGEEKARKQMHDQFSKEVRVSLLLKPEHAIEYFD